MSYRRSILTFFLLGAAASLHAQDPCVKSYDAATIAGWRRTHPAGYPAQEPVLNVESPFPSEVILHFYDPATGALFQSYRVPPGVPLRGLRYKGKPFLPASDWGVRLSKGGQTGCTRFLGSLLQPDPSGGMLLHLGGFLENGFLAGATPGVPQPPRPKSEAPEEEPDETPQEAPKPAAKDAPYSISVHNQNSFPIEVTVSYDAGGREQVQSGIRVPAGAKQLLFTSPSGSFCIRAEYTDATGQRKGWGGNSEKVVNGEKKKFQCRTLGATQRTYTAVYRGG